MSWFTLAVYSKISAVPFAAVALLIARQVQGLSWRTAARKTAGFFVIALVFMTHRHLVIGQSSQTAPISGTYPQTLVDMLPVAPEYLRFLYLPLIGWLLMAGGLLESRVNWRMGVSVGVVLLLAWMGLAWGRSFLWQNELTLFVKSSHQGRHIQRQEKFVSPVAPR